MVYKFDSAGTSEKDNTYLEFSSESGTLKIYSGNYEDEIIGNVHYLDVDEIDEMIVALTNIKNSISQWKRDQLKNN